MPGDWEYVDATSNTANDWEYVDAPASTPAPKRKASATPVADGRAVVSSLYPNAKITDNIRDPNSPLGRANPDSWHNHTAAAVDIARIPGMTFEQYLKGYKDAGYDILESRDEYTNPVSHQTGGNWHVVLGGGSSATPQAGAGTTQKTDLNDWAYQEDDGTKIPVNARINQRGSMQVEDSVPFEGLGRTDRMGITDEVAQNNAYVESAVTSAKKQNIPFEAIDADLAQKFPEWYSRNKAAVKYYYDTGAPFNWVGNPAAPESNQNVGPDIVVEGQKTKAPYQEQLNFLADAAAEGYDTGVLGNLVRLGGEALGTRTEEDITNDRIARLDRQARLENSPMSGTVAGELGRFGANIVGGIGPDYLLPMGVGKSALTRVVSAPILAAGVDAALQGAENLTGMQEGFDYTRNLTAAATGGVTQAGIAEPLLALANKYKQGGAAFSTFDNPRVIETSDVAAGNAPPTGRGAAKAWKDRLGQEVSRITAGWQDSPTIVVHSTKNAFKKAEPALFAKVEADGAGKAPGFYDDEGRIHVLGHNIKDASKLDSLVFHEALGHYGLWKQYQDTLSGELNRLYDRNWRLEKETNDLATTTKYADLYASTPESRAALEEAKKLPTQEARRAAIVEVLKADPEMRAKITEEVLAKRSEGGAIDKNILDRMSVVMRQFVRDMGLDIRVSNREVKAFLADAHSAVINRANEGNPTGKSGTKYSLSTHVSPYDFSNVDAENPYGAFDSSKMGSGEGAQVYGWGHYTGEKTRENYFRKFEKDTDGVFLADGKTIDQSIRDYFEPDFTADSMRVYDAIQEIRSDLIDYWLKGRDTFPTVYDFIDNRINELQARYDELKAKPKQSSVNVGWGDDAASIDLDRAEMKAIDYQIDAYKHLSSQYLYENPGMPKTYDVPVPENISKRMLQLDEDLADQPEIVKKAFEEQGIVSVDKEARQALEDKRLELADKVATFYDEKIYPWEEARRKVGTDAYDKVMRENGIPPDSPLRPSQPVLKAAIEAEAVAMRVWAGLPENRIEKTMREYIALENELDSVTSDLMRMRVVTGGDAYFELANRLGSDKAASLYLASKGVPGNKFRDGFSRYQSGDPSYNYVWFNDKGPDAPKITAKYMLEMETVPEKTVNKFMQAMKGARILNADYAARVSEDRKAKMKDLAKARATGKGEAGLNKELATLRGKTAKNYIDPFREKFTEKEAKALFDYFKNNPKYGWYESIRAREALRKLFEGEVPTKGELDLLSKTMPKEFVRYALELRTKGVKLNDMFVEAVNIPRAMMASIDLSAPFRQGIFFVGRKRFWQNLPKMFAHMWDEDYHNIQMDLIKSRPTYSLMKESGLDLTEMGGLDTAAREEDFIATSPTKIPVIGRGVKASNRAYTGFLNQLRADVFDDLVKKASQVGIYMADDIEAAKGLASYINNATGRGTMGKLTQHAPLLTAGFFSPRLIASRFNLLLNPVYYAKLHPFARKEAITDLIRTTALITTVIGLADYAGADVEWDPRSSDFGKIRIGKNRYDVYGGFGQYVTLAARMLSGQTKTLKGEVRDLGPEARQTRGDVLARFFRGKAAPIPAYALNALYGENVVGEKFDVKKDTAQMLTPLFIQDLIDGFKDQGTLGAAMKLPSAFGIGSTTIDVVPYKYDEYGREVDAVQKPDDEAIAEIKRLTTATDEEGKPLVKTRLLDHVDAGSLPEGKIRDAAKPEDIDSLQKLSADYLMEDWNNFITTQEYKEMTDAERVKEFRRLKKIAREDARADLWPEQGE